MQKNFILFPQENVTIHSYPILIFDKKNNKKTEHRIPPNIAPGA